MMGSNNKPQDEFFYSFNLEHIDHLSVLERGKLHIE